MAERFDIVKIFEPSTNATAPNRYIALAGSSDKTQKVFVASSLSPTDAVFNNCNPPSEHHMVDKKILIRARVHMQFTGTTTTGNLLKKGRDGLRYLPLHSVINVARCSINNVDINCDIYNTLHARSNYWRPEVDQLSRTKASSAIKDNCQNYSDMFGTINSPLSGFGDSGLTSGQGRGVISDLDIRVNNAGAAELVFTVTEPLIMAPFSHDDNDAGGPLWNINSLAFNFAFISNLNRMWCHDDAGGSIITQMTTTIENLELLMTFLTPPPNLVLPPVCTTTYSFFNVWSKTVGSLNPNEDRSFFNSDVIQLDRVPQSLFLFAKIDNNLVLSMPGSAGASPPVITTPDTSCQLGRLRMNYMNRAALLNNATEEQLYDICLANGYNRDYQEFRGLINGTFDTGSTIGLTGSVYRFIFGKDIVVDGVVPGLGGVDGRSNFQIEVSVKNINQTTPLPITFYMVGLTEGVLQIVPQSAIQHLAPIISVDEVHNAPIVDLPYRSYQEIIGGGLWDVLKNVGKKAADFAKEKKLISTGLSMIKHPAAQVASQAASALGYGGMLASGGILAAGGRGVTQKELRMIKQRKY